MTTQSVAVFHNPANECSAYLVKHRESNALGTLAEKNLPTIFNLWLVCEQATPLHFTKGKGNVSTISKTDPVGCWGSTTLCFYGSYFCYPCKCWKRAKIHLYVLHQPVKESNSPFEGSGIICPPAHPSHLPSLVRAICSPREFSGFSSFLEPGIRFCDYKGRKGTYLKGFQLWRIVWLGQCSSVWFLM